ncbi:MAG: hypothetical protein LBU32_30395 [Clostridiales bacterium]|nr:hypothetical protein [Clostridiales bacterium]
MPQNQIRTGAAADKENALFPVEGTGKPSRKKAYEAFGNHIERGAALICGKGPSPAKPAQALDLKSIECASKDLKGPPGEDNPMNPASRARHQGCLNLFASASNPPAGLLEKAELMIKTAFAYPKH